MPVNNGGPAFPRPMTYAYGCFDQGAVGMTLRDWFAGQALVGVLTNQDAMAAIHRNRKSVDQGREILAVLVYQVADAMLAERAKAKDSA